MKRADLEKLRRLDPKVAAQLERKLAEREAARAAEKVGFARPAPLAGQEARAQPRVPEGLYSQRSAAEEAPSPLVPPTAGGRSEAPNEPEETPQAALDTCEQTQPATAPAERRVAEGAGEASVRVEFAPEGFQEPLLPPEDFEVDDQTLLFCGGSTAEVEDALEEKPGETDVLLAKLQRALPFEAGLPACKRSAESQALPTWRERSTRREDEAFAHPPEHADLRGMPDAKLGELWGWMSKHRGRGLSARDEAVQREVYARSLGMLDLYGLDWAQGGSAYLREALRKLGTRSEIARTIVALFELMVQRERMALRLSGPDARTLCGWSLSAWWAAVARLEDLGVLRRVGGLKKSEHGEAPVQVDTNLYVLGPWWFASEGKEPTPLQTVLGLFAQRETRQPNREAARAHHRLLQQRKERRRASNTTNRDRNRRRHHDLPPKAVTSKAVLRETEALARRRQARDEAQKRGRDRARVQAMLRGASFGLGEHQADPPPCPSVSSEAAERAAQSLVRLTNSGLRPNSELLHQESRTLKDALEDLEIELPSGNRSALPKGKTEGNFVFTRETTPNLKRTSARLEQPPPESTATTSVAKASDKSGKPSPLRDRARALDGRKPTWRQGPPPKSGGKTVIDQIRDMYQKLYGNQMPE